MTDVHPSAIALDARGASDTFLLANGAFAPLTGFMTHDEARSAVESLELPSGELWPLPILLRVEETGVLRRGAREPLTFGGLAVGTITIAESFRVPASWAHAVYGTDDVAHPGVAAFLSAPSTAVAGEVEWLAGRGVAGLT